MNEQHDITLREAEGPNRSLLEDIVREIKNMVPSGGDAARNYVKGKGQQQLAKVQEIQSRVYEKIGQLEIERQRLIQERDEGIVNAELQRERDSQSHKEHMYALRTKRLKELASMVKILQELGIEIELDVIKKAVEDLVKEDSS